MTRLLLIHALSIFAASVLIAIFSVRLSLAFVLGAVVSVIGNAYFTMMALRFRLTPTSTERDANFALQQMSRGLRGKLMLCASLLAMIFVFLNDMSPAAVFAGFIYSLVVHWFIASAISSEYMAHTNHTTNTDQDSNLND